MALDQTIERTGDGKVVVTALNASDAIKSEGVTCLNPSDPPEEQKFQKTFSRKKIYLPSEYDEAVRDHISHPDSFVVSMNGYSVITDEQSRRYGVEKGAYEAACKAIMHQVVEHVNARFKGANLKIIHGGVYFGVDGAIHEVAKEFGMTPLGFSCPRYMLYVEDDDTPVYVGSDNNEYSDRFIQTLDFLIATGGREQSLQHDVLAACIHNKRIHFIDVLNSLSSTGGVPATVIDEKGVTKVDNAAAAMGRNLSFFSYSDAVKYTPQEGDVWDAIFSNVRGVATEVCRDKMSPDKKF